MADDVDPIQSLTNEAAAPATPGGPAGTAPAENPLPTMADLDRVSSELDDIDARLAALDQQRP